MAYALLRPIPSLLVFLHRVLAPDKHWEVKNRSHQNYGSSDRALVQVLAVTTSLVDPSGRTELEDRAALLDRHPLGLAFGAAWLFDLTCCLVCRRGAGVDRGCRRCLPLAGPFRL